MCSTRIIESQKDGNDIIALSIYKIGARWVSDSVQRVSQLHENLSVKQKIKRLTARACDKRAYIGAFFHLVIPLSLRTSNVIRNALKARLDAAITDNVGRTCGFFFSRKTDGKETPMSHQNVRSSNIFVSHLHRLPSHMECAIILMQYLMRKHADDGLQVWQSKPQTETAKMREWTASRERERESVCLCIHERWRTNSSNLIGGWAEFFFINKWSDHFCFK